MSVRGNTAGEYFGDWFGPVEVVPGSMSASIGGSGGITATLTAAPADTPQETGKGWPRNRRERRKEKRRQQIEARNEARFEGISAEVARFEQAKQQKAAEAPRPVVDPDVPPEPQTRVVAASDAVSAELVQAILDAWARIEERRALQERQAQEVALAEIARIRAIKEEELMIVTMMAALA